MQLDKDFKYKNSTECAKAILNKEGIRGYSEDPTQQLSEKCLHMERSLLLTSS